MSPRSVRALAAPVLALFAVLALAFVAAPVRASDPTPSVPLDGARLRLKLETLLNTGTALFVAAHPDDENTAMLTWLSAGRKVRTAYLSVTRGDGGQNLIGSDTGDRLGVIRTHELLQARRIDGAEQFFTRAIDFGYSKTADETLELWGREAILSDVVRVIRTLRPDVIVTRFPTDGGGGHGHHTASALLAEEAFDAAADPKRFPEQIAAGLQPWQAKRVVWNAFRFGSAGPDTTPGRLRLDLGAYDALLARSYTELAGESRSMHKSQGFGSAERRGRWENTFEHRKGARAKADLFEDVDLTWKRIAGGDRVAAALEKALKAFDPRRPQAILPLLLDADAAMAALPDQPIVRHRREELREVIRGAAGLWVEAVAARPLASPGSSVRVALSALDRSGAGVQVERVTIAPAGLERAGPPARLAPNVAWSDTAEVAIPADAPVTGPYWLDTPAVGGAHTVANAARIGTPESPPVMTARFELSIAGRRVTLEEPVVYRWTDPVHGERYRAFEVAPPVRLKFDRDVRLRAPGHGAVTPVRVTVGAGDVSVEGRLWLDCSDGCENRGEPVTLRLRPGGPDTTVTFPIAARSADGRARAFPLQATFSAAGRAYGTRVVELDYPHIPLQTLSPPAVARLIDAEVKVTAQRVGYVMGSGDAGPEALREMGVEVTLLGDEDVEGADLARFDAIVVGVRAYNTRPRLRSLQPRLLDYVANGGRLVVQYQTAEGALQDRLGPFPFRISRDRVTVEGAEIRTPNPDHALLTRPNRITADDFAGWVQERGLYFASPYDPKYEAVLSSNDPGEPARDGGLLFARHGKGVFIYTGYAFFRQLPAAVPGAWRLFANLVSPER